MLRRAVLAIGLLSIAACGFDLLDYTGKQCPCPSGYGCDPATKTCVVQAAGAGGATGGTSGTTTPTGGCTPAIAPTNFRVGWTTPNTIRWEWDSAGTVDQFGSYRVVVGPTKDAVDTGAGATVITAAQNPELGQFDLLHTGSIDPVVATIVDGLTPDTTYYGKLVAVDNAGCEVSTEVLSAKTKVPPIGQIPLFVDAIPDGGYTIPGSLTLKDSCSSGSACLAYQSACNGEPECFENLRLDFDVPPDTIASQLSQGNFQSLAYFEVRVSVTAKSVPFWSNFWLRTADAQPWVSAPYTFVDDGTWRTYQIPLRVFERDGTPLDYGKLVDAMAGGLHELDVGGSWADGAQVYIDDASIRW